MRSILTRSSVRNAWRTGRSTTLPLQRNFSFGPFGKPQPTQILEIDLSPGGLDLTNTDHPNLQLMSQKQQIPLFRALQALQKAAYDEKIAGVSFILGRSLNLSDVQELRKIVQLFKSQGKITSVFAENYSSEWNYYLASAFQNIWMLPTGLLELNPKLEEKASTHWKGALQTLGVHVDVVKKKDYKAPGALGTIDSKRSPQQDEEHEHLFLKGWLHQSKSDIVSDGRVDIKNINELFDLGITSADEGIRRNFITGVDYLDQVNLKMLKKLGISEDQLKKSKDRSKFIITIAHYVKKMEKINNSEVSPSFLKRFFLRKSKPDVVAVIPLSGSITSFGMGAQQGIDSHRVKKIIRAAYEDPQVKSIVIRCSSGGGSVHASDIIGHEIENAKLKGKPVVFSMGTVSASGGYWIAAPSSCIIANEGTITGSIGCFMPQISIQPLLTKLDVHVDHSPGNKSPANNLHSILVPTTPEKRAIIDSLADDIYQKFKAHVGLHRKIDLQEMENLAQGKTYTGIEAKKVKLIDEIGGYIDALRIAQQLGKIEILGRDGRPHLKFFPEKEPLSKRIQNSLSKKGKNSEDLNLVDLSVADFHEILMNESIEKIMDNSLFVPFLKDNLGLQFSTKNGFQNITHPEIKMKGFRIE